MRWNKKASRKARFIYLFLLEKQRHGADSKTKRKPNEQIGRVMPTKGKPRITKPDGAKEKQCAYNGQVGQKRHGNDRCAGKMTAGEGRAFPLFFL